MNFCLAVVFENAIFECGNCVRVNPQILSLIKDVCSLFRMGAVKSILELNGTKHVCDRTINIK